MPRRATAIVASMDARPALIEFPADDPERALRFWAGLLGDELAERSDAEGRGWQTHSGGPVIGVHQRGTGPGDTVSLPYFEVHDLGTALDTVRDLGGTVIHPGSRSAVCRDSEGSPFGLSLVAQEAAAPMPGAPQTTTEANRRIIRDAFEAWQAGSAAIADVFAEDLVWRIEGHSAASKEYASRQQFVDEVLAPFGARFAGGERFAPVRIRSVTADGDTVVVIWDGHGVANDGKPYDNSYVWSMRLADGLVIDGTAFFDSISFNDLWARVAPQ